MRPHIPSPLALSILLLEAPWKQVDAFGVAPPRTKARPDSSLCAIEGVVEALATGGTGLVDAATAAASTALASGGLVDAATAAVQNLAPSTDVLSNIEVLNNIEALNNLDLSASSGILSPESAAVVGTVFGTGGFVVGSISTGVRTQGERKKFIKDIEAQKSELDDLNANLAAAKKKQLETEEKSKETVDKLENQIFVMDQEFEESTATLQQEYEERVKREVQNRGEKIEQDLKFKYDIRMDRERQEMLQEKLDYIEKESAATSLVKQEEITMAKLELAESQSKIAALQNTLSKSESEVENLETMIREGKNPSFLFNSANLKLKVKDMEKNLDAMEKAMQEKEKEVEETNREVEELRTKLADPLYFIKEFLGVDKQ